MKKIKLNDSIKENTIIGEFILNPNEKYLINIEEELEYQIALLKSFQIMGPPPAIKNYHAWLYEHDFNIESPNPSNEFVESYYGVKPLWKTPYSQGIVVKAEGEDDFYIVLECSSKNKGYKNAQIILTLGGCC